MLFLHIYFPDNLVSEKMVLQKKIPCFCRISGSRLFEIEFFEPLPSAIGVIEGWSPELINERVSAGGGGKYTHYCFSVVSLEQIDSNIYGITSLDFFDEMSGWISIIDNGEWSKPQLHSQGEIDRWEAMFP
ncbi:MAG: hypothetical protein ACRCSI_08795 [Eubacterium aggregans]